MSRSPTTRSSLGTALLAVVLAMAPAIGLAQGGPDIGVRTDPDIGAHLVAADGRTIYVFGEDAPFRSNCDAACTEQWQPLTFSGIAPSSQGVNVILVGSLLRSDGSSQATYGGLPLYTFVGDEEEGSFAGAGVDEAWYPLSPDGSPIVIAASGGSEEAEAGTVDAEALFARGREVFGTFCFVCHGSDGRGGAGPDLNANPRVADDAFIVVQIRDGISEMPGFGGVLSNDDLAAVATFVRASWGNDYPAMTPEQFQR